MILWLKLTCESVVFNHVNHTFFTACLFHTAAIRDEGERVKWDVLSSVKFTPPPHRVFLNVRFIETTMLEILGQEGI